MLDVTEHRKLMEFNTQDNIIRCELVSNLRSEVIHYQGAIIVGFNQRKYRIKLLIFKKHNEMRTSSTVLYLPEDS